MTGPVLVTGDLKKGNGIDAAVAGANVIVHCATGLGDVGAARHLIDAARRPWTLLRATQFHSLILRGCRALAHLPVMPVPGHTSFQPVDAGEVAGRLAELAVGPPAGRVPDMGGPEIRGAGDLARIYLEAVGRRRPVLPVRLPGAAFAGHRRGDHLAPDRAVGRITFAQFLAGQVTS